jgi:hypothetical protein
MQAGSVARVVSMDCKTALEGSIGAATVVPGGPVMTTEESAVAVTVGTVAESDTRAPEGSARISAAFAELTRKDAVANAAVSDRVWMEGEIILIVQGNVRRCF